MNKLHFNITKSDAIEYLISLKDESIDLIITDPPYESLEKYRAIGTTTRLKHSKSSSNNWFKIFPNSRFPDFFHEIFRVLRKNSHFYLFCDSETMFITKPIGESVGFRFWKPIVWDKVKIGMGYHYRARYEFILFFEKGKRKLTNLGTPDILEFKRIRNGYPTEKPVDLMKVLVEQSSNTGELIVDPFMGSGSAGVAALGLKRNFAGNDLSTDAYTLAKSRFDQIV